MKITNNNDERNWSTEPVRRDKLHSKKRVAGPPRGNKNAVKHALYFYKRLLSGDGLKRSTALYHALAAKEQELVSALGGDPSPQERAIIADTVKTMLYIGSLDAYLMGLKSIVRKGKPHPVLDMRSKLAGNLRENLKTVGLKRVPKEIPDLARELQRSQAKEKDGDVERVP